jgi:hypothetical protein
MVLTPLRDGGTLDPDDDGRDLMQIEWTSTDPMYTTGPHVRSYEAEGDGWRATVHRGPIGWGWSVFLSDPAINGFTGLRQGRGDADNYRTAMAHVEREITGEPEVITGPVYPGRPCACNHCLARRAN